MSETVRRDPTLFGELNSVRQPWRLWLRTPALARAPRGRGRLTFDIPGYLAPEASMAPLRFYLRRLGHDARPWGGGTNDRDLEAKIHRFTDRVERAVERHGRPANLVGWSLGGVVARSVARQRPDLVHRVVTFGSPAVGGAVTRTPLTVVYSRRDAIVPWHLSIDRRSPGVEHVEVDSEHIGMGLDPDVWLAVARALAER